MNLELKLSENLLKAVCNFGHSTRLKLSKGKLKKAWSHSIRDLYTGAKDIFK